MRPALRVFLAFVLGVCVLTWRHDAHAGCDCPSSPTLMCVAGRAGTTNNATVSTSGDGTVTGSTAANKSLKLVSNSQTTVAGNGGTVWVTGPSPLTFNDAALAGLMIDFDGVQMAGSALSELLAIEIGTKPPGVDTRSTWNFANTTGNTAIGMDFGPVINVPTGITAPVVWNQGLRFDPILQTTGTGTMTEVHPRKDNAVYDIPRYQANPSGTLTIQHAAVISEPQFDGTGTGASRWGLYVGAPIVTNGATINEDTGVFCATADHGAGTTDCIVSNVNVNATKTNHGLRLQGTAPSRIAGPLRLGDTTDPNEKLEVAGNVLSIGDTLTNLGTPPVGALRYCTNCNAATDPCTSGGTGTMAIRIAGPKWKCL